MGQRRGRLLAARSRSKLRARSNPHSGRFPLGTGPPILKIGKVLCDSCVWHLGKLFAQWEVTVRLRQLMSATRPGGREG